MWLLCNRFVTVSNVGVCDNIGSYNNGIRYFSDVVKVVNVSDVISDVEVSSVTVSDVLVTTILDNTKLLGGCIGKKDFFKRKCHSLSLSKSTKYIFLQW